MNFKLPPQIKTYLGKLAPIARHHYFIATVLLFSSVAYGVYTVNQTLATQPDESYKTEKLQSTIGSKFNANTQRVIDQIEDLQKSTDAAGAPTPLPSGRINPFAE